jgi:hypothetical protein
MREQDQDPSASTGPFRDPSASTAQFRAFAGERPGDDPVPPWVMRAQRSQVLILAGVVVAVAVILAVIALIFIG